MTPTTTTGASRQGDARQTTRPGKAQQQPQPFPKNQNGSIMTHQFTEGQHVYCQHDTWKVPRIGHTVAYVPPAAASGHDYPAWIVAYPPSTDEHPAVQALAIYDGMHRGLFRAEELQPVSADDAPPTTDAEAVTFLTGGLPPEPSNVDEYRCDVENCGFHLLAAGPVAIDEADPFQEEVDAERGTVAEVPVVEVWMALQEIPEMFDLLARVADLPRAAVARALVAVAAVVDPEAAR